MKCKLCGDEKGKLCKAHLIPESFYRFMYPNGFVEGDALKVLLHKESIMKRSRIGVYDDNILCASCDELLGKLDEYGAKVLLDFTPQLVNTNGDIDTFKLENVNVIDLNTFFLSVLWRCSISTRNEVIHINLGVEFEEKIRLLLYQKEGTISDYPTIITKFKFVNHDYKKLVLMPVPKDIEGINHYDVYFPNGYKVLIKVDNSPQQQVLRPLTAKDDSSVYVISYEYFEESDEYIKTSMKLKTMKKF